MGAQGTVTSSDPNCVSFQKLTRVSPTNVNNNIFGAGSETVIVLDIVFKVNFVPSVKDIFGPVKVKQHVVLK